MLSHALESFVATDADPITQALSKEAFSIVLAHLPASFGGNTGVRLRLHCASTMAGMAFTQAGLGICHALSHSLGGMFHLPHGRLNAILLPVVVEHNAQVAGQQYARLARSAGLAGSADTLAVRNLKTALIRLRRELGMPDTLVRAGIDQGQLQRYRREIAEAALQDPCCATNPRKVDLFLINRILDEVTGRV